MTTIYRDPIRIDLIKECHGCEYDDGGENLFRLLDPISHRWVPPHQMPNGECAYCWGKRKVVTDLGNEVLELIQFAIKHELLIFDLKELADAEQISST